MHLLEWRSTGLRSYVIELGKQMVLRRDRLVLTVILGSETKQERPEIERKMTISEKGFRENIVLRINMYISNVYTKQTTTGFTSRKCGKSIKITLFFSAKLTFSL